MKALFFGLGSVGQRHLRNLKAQYPECELFAVRTGGSNLVIESGKGEEVESLAAHYGFVELTSDQLKEKNFDLGFVCGPSSTHFGITAQLLKIGVSCFVEKPVTTTVSELKELQALCKETDGKVMVGFQTRWNPIYQKAKQYIGEKKSQIVSVDAEWGTFLPHHHPYEDYRKGYAAREDLGGGVILCLIHELDLISDFFGAPKKFTASLGSFSDLEMTAEDTITALLRYEEFVASLFLSFAQTKETRLLKVVFNDSTLFLDLGRNTLEVFDLNGEQIIKEEGTSRDQWFQEELKDFVSASLSGDKLTPDLFEVETSLRLAEAFKQSSKEEWHEFSI